MGRGRDTLPLQPHPKNETRAVYTEELTHLWRAAFDPFLISLRSLFQVGAEVLGNETLPECWDNRLDHFPDTEKLSAGLEEEVLMQQIVVEQSTGLFPITDDHTGERACFRTHRSNPHG